MPLLPELSESDSETSSDGVDTEEARSDGERDIVGDMFGSGVCDGAGAGTATSELKEPFFIDLNNNRLFLLGRKTADKHGQPEQSGTSTDPKKRNIFRN